MKSVIKNKKGDEKYYFIISLIIGILVLALVMYFIFQEYFTQDELNYEVCRQSIVLRANLPEKDLLIYTASTKGAYDLKCQTQVLNINYKDVPKFQKTFGDALVGSWYLIGNGAFRIFPAKGTGLTSHCFVTYRIHIDEKVKDYYANISASNPEVDSEQDNWILKKALDMSYANNKSYYAYLKTVNPEMNPFVLARGGSYDFKVYPATISLGELITAVRNTAGIALSLGFWSPKVAGSDNIGGYTLPVKLDPAKGDVFIVVATLETATREQGSAYMFWIQAKDLPLLNSKLQSNLVVAEYLCEYVDTIPA